MTCVCGCGCPAGPVGLAPAQVDTVRTGTVVLTGTTAPSVPTGTVLVSLDWLTEVQRRLITVVADVERVRTV